MSSKTTVLTTLTSPLRNFILKAEQANHPSPAPVPTTPRSWICHHCIYVLDAQAASNTLTTPICHGCAHERCGLCDTIYHDRDAGVAVHDEASRVWYHYESTAVV